MELLDFLTPSDELSANGGPEDHIVLSSRVRLARNISGVPFPGRLARWWGAQGTYRRIGIRSLLPLSI